jgi:regulator of replication initiation timing
METKQELRNEIHTLYEKIDDMKQTYKDLEIENENLHKKLDHFNASYDNWKVLNEQFLKRYIKEYLKDNMSVELKYDGDYGSGSQLSSVNIKIDDVIIESSDKYPTYY